MALKTLQKIYEGADLSAPQSGVMYFRIEENCTIKEILIYADSPVSADAVFNCKLNGTDLFSGAARPKIAAGEESGLKTGLSIAALKGDKFVLSLESVSASVDAPVTLLLTVDDGVSSGGGSNSAAYGADIPPASPNAENDEFNSTALNADWTVTTTGTAPTVSLNQFIQSYIFLKFGASSGSYTLRKALAGIGTGNFSITYKFAIRPALPGQYLLSYIGNSSTVIAFYYIYASPLSANITVRQFPSGSTIFTQSVNHGTETYFHLQRVAGVIQAYFSNDGIAWQATSPYTDSFAIDELRIETANGGSPLTAGIDWIRRDWLFL